MQNTATLQLRTIYQKSASLPLTIQIQTRTQTQTQTRGFATGTRGSRGHGWLHKYRKGLGGRHLQGRYHNRDLEKRVAINNQVFALNDNHNHNHKERKRNVAFLDLKIEDKNETQRVTIELASEVLPNTCENFMALCTGTSATSASTSSTSSTQNENGTYQNSKVFKIEPKVGICLGDVTEANNGLQGTCHSSTPNQNATGSPDTFAHESTVLSHAQKGMVSMLSTGLDKNDSRFMITTVEDAPHLDGRYVAFGRVMEGLDVLEGLVKNVYTKKGRPQKSISIVNCGVL